MFCHLIIILFFVFLTSPHICLSFLLFFVDEAAVRSRHHAQALFFRVSCVVMRQATNFKRAQLAPYTMRLCTMSLLGGLSLSLTCICPLFCIRCLRQTRQFNQPLCLSLSQHIITPSPPFLALGPLCIVSENSADAMSNFLIDPPSKH